MDNKHIRCKKCSYYNTRSNEFSISDEFINGAEFDSSGIKMPSCIWESNVLGITMCSHPDCFLYVKKVDPVNGKQYNKKRVKGQGQLNKDNTCSRFKNAWWRFWIISRGPKEEELFLDKI